jgi:hypothetical protein
MLHSTMGLKVCSFRYAKNHSDLPSAKCQEGIVAGAAGAVQTVDTFAASIHWATYRASLFSF